MIDVLIILGASNVSFGLPDRQTINQAFLALSFSAGATCVIAEPGKLALKNRLEKTFQILRKRDRICCSGHRRRGIELDSR